MWGLQGNYIDEPVCIVVCVCIEYSYLRYMNKNYIISHLFVFPLTIESFEAVHNHIYYERISYTSSQLWRGCQTLIHTPSVQNMHTTFNSQQPANYILVHVV